MKNKILALLMIAISIACIQCKKHSIRPLKSEGKIVNIFNGKPLTDLSTIRCYYNVTSNWGTGHEESVSAVTDINADGTYSLDLKKLPPKKEYYFEIISKKSGKAYGYVIDGYDGVVDYKELKESKTFQVYPQAIIWAIDIDSSLNIYKPTTVVIKTEFKEYSYPVTFNVNDSNYYVKYYYDSNNMSTKFFLDHAKESVINYYFIKSDGAASPVFTLKKVFNAGEQKLVLFKL